jgi:hypothetical protein
MVKYKIVHHPSIEKLEEEVNLLLEEGWYPLGGLVVDSEQGEHIQTLILEK